MEHNILHLRDMHLRSQHEGEWCINRYTKDSGNTCTYLEDLQKDTGCKALKSRHGHRKLI